MFTTVVLWLLVFVVTLFILFMYRSLIGCINIARRTSFTTFLHVSTFHKRFLNTVLQVGHCNGCASTMSLVA
jgi:hypothetical protein